MVAPYTLLWYSMFRDRNMTSGNAFDYNYLQDDAAAAKPMKRLGHFYSVKIQSRGL